MKFRKKPVIIEAFRYGYDNRPDWFCDLVSKNKIVTRDDSCDIHTLEGVMLGAYGDYIIKGIRGEVYACKYDIFLETYESLDDINNNRNWTEDYDLENGQYIQTCPCGSRFIGHKRRYWCKICGTDYR